MSTAAETELLPKKTVKPKKLTLKKKVREDLQILLQKKFLAGLAHTVPRAVELRSGKSTIKGRKVQYTLKEEDAVLTGTKPGDILEGRITINLRRVRRG